MRSEGDKFVLEPIKFFLAGYVALDRGGSDDLALFIGDRRDCDGNGYAASGSIHSYCLIVLEMLTFFESGKNFAKIFF